MDDIGTLVLVGGHPALDLANTVERGIPAPGTMPGDALRAPADAVTWALRVSVLDPDEAVGSTPRSLASLRALREALYAIVRAADGELAWTDVEVATSLSALDRARAAAGRRSTLRPPNHEGGALRVDVGMPGPHLIDDRIAVAATELLSSDLASRIRRCPIAEGGCGWVFVDRTKNGSRTWCRMADCGTAVKSRRLTERRREQRRPHEATR